MPCPHTRVPCACRVAAPMQPLATLATWNEARASGSSKLAAPAKNALSSDAADTPASCSASASAMRSPRFAGALPLAPLAAAALVAPSVAGGRGSLAVGAAWEAGLRPGGASTHLPQHIALIRHVGAAARNYCTNALRQSAIHGGFSALDTS